MPFQIRGAAFNRRIIIESPTQTADSFGQSSYGPAAPGGTWAPVTTCFAAIDPGTGMEKRVSDREINESPTMIYVRYGAGKNVTAKMRCRDLVSGAIFDIRDVSHVECGRRLMQFPCRVVN